MQTKKAKQKTIITMRRKAIELWLKEKGTIVPLKSEVK